MTISRSSRVLLLGAVVLVAAPTAGNLGSCGQTAELLDEDKFFAAKRAVDCSRCEECGLSTEACVRACDGVRTDFEVFPEECAPLVHDGEVCLDALLAASCSDVEGYVADQAPTQPTECNFCPVDGEGAPLRGDTP
jgi:hypothetical protein